MNTGQTCSHQGKPRFLDQVRQALHVRHYSSRTEAAYVGWIRRYILFHRLRHPAEMGELEINTFLSHLVWQERVSAATQKPAFAALLFLYRHVLHREVGELGAVVRARKYTRLPVVLRRDEVRAVLSFLEGSKWLVASPMYGTGFRLMECLRLRVHGIDWGRREMLSVMARVQRIA